MKLHVPDNLVLSFNHFGIHMYMLHVCMYVCVCVRVCMYILGFNFKVFRVVSHRTLVYRKCITINKQTYRLSEKNEFY